MISGFRNLSLCIFKNKAKENKDTQTQKDKEKKENANITIYNFLVELNNKK